ncbi:uncharacterized protein Apoltp isoform X2 [Periplaneta americana]|uniref:uncharacterized protein Apoltp isoform X2 n=1 Tax=Periplaneta americana TaxID=6978 RepID=UPI0037E77F94
MARPDYFHPRRKGESNGVVLVLLAAVVFLLRFTETESNPLKDPNVCGRPTCTPGGKFAYLTTTKYEYQYTSEIATLFGGTSTNKSTLYISAQVSLVFPTPCEGVMQVSQIALAEAAPFYDREEDTEIPSPELPHSQEFSRAISQHPLRFSFTDGLISEVCPHADEANWVLNFKRGIISTFQNTMKRFDVDHYSLDADVNGVCETKYSLRGARETSLVISKKKDMSTCTYRYKHHSILQTTPYLFRNNYQPMPIMKSNSSCEMSVDHNIYNKIECQEVHLFQPFSGNNSGAQTTTKQVLTLLSEKNTTEEETPDLVSRRSTLLFDHDQTPKPVSGELRASRDLIKAMCKLNMDDIQPEFPDAFTKFVHTARLLSYPALSQVYNRANSICSTGRRHILDALPMLGSNAAVAVMKDIILKNGVPQDVVHEWLFALSFIPRPDLQTINILTPLLKWSKVDAQFYLSVSTVVHSYCKWNFNCKSAPEVANIIHFLEAQVQNGCQHKEGDQATLEKTLVAIKALGNIGIPVTTLNPTLRVCIENKQLPMEIKIAAIHAHRRLPCQDTREYFLKLFRDQSVDSELRIASYLEVMKCPTYIIVKTVKHSLEEEEVNQVGSFVWSHLTNLLKSSSPSKVEIQALLQDKDLSSKFNSDMRKYSRNYEGSMFFENYNVGGSYESNVIFSPKSYLPRSAMFNLTVDLFGESVNVLEVAGRMEGFEHYVESIFGPNGPLSSSKVKEGLEKFRFLRSVPEDLKSKVHALPNVVDTNFDDPQASIGMKIFGNELRYHKFSGDREIKAALNAINPVEKIKQLLSGKEINYNKATLFLDTSYVVPTATGLPISLSAIGTAAVNLQISGSLKAADFLKTHELDVEGKIRPSVAIDIVGTMGVDAYYASTGIKLRTNMYSSSAVEGQLKVRGAKLVSVNFNLPKDKIEIINARSELIVMHGDKEEFQAGIKKGRIEQHVCSWQSLDRTLGLNFCGDYQFPECQLNASSECILKGPAKFAASVQKADPSAKKYLLEYRWDTTEENVTIISFMFDTPDSKLKRELSARLHLDMNSQNLTLLLQSNSSRFQAHGKYKNTEKEKYIQFGLNIDGKKHFDAELGLKIKDVKYGHIYQPRLYLAINNERIAELSDKEVVITLDLTIPRGSLLFIDAKINITLPSFNPMLLELKLHEKSPNEYDIEVSGTWFSGHNFNAKGLYQDRTTAKMTSHNLKLLIKSPSFNEIAVSCKILRDDKELKVDFQADHNQDKYSLLFKHASPSLTEFQTYIDLRYKKSIYTLTATVNLLNYKQVLLELHLDQHRDIHIALKGMNQDGRKEAGIEIKWDANRDPGQKFAAAVEFANPEKFNYSGAFLLAYPGRTVKGNFHLAIKGTTYRSAAHLEWSPKDAIEVTLVAMYDYTKNLLARMNCELLTPFENWKRTSVSGGVRHEGNLFRVNGSVYWQDDQNISLDFYSDYLISETDLLCELNASVVSTIPQVSSMSGSFYHKQTNKRFDTNIHVQYHPQQILTVKSTWEYERSTESSNLTGVVSMVSPFDGYQKGALISRVHINKDWDITGAADMNLDTRKYTLILEGHLKKLTDSMLVFNVTTPFHKYGTITGRFGYSEIQKHLVAEIKGPSGGVGIEILFSITSITDFDVKFSLETPMEFLTKALIIGKLKKDMVDFRCGWNALVLGFSGVWHYATIKDFEYNYRIYTPLEGFEENGILAKVIYKDGLDFAVGIMVSDIKLGLKISGASKHLLLKDLNFESTKQEQAGKDPDYDYEEEEDDEESQDALSWRGVIELDTILYPTMKGTLDIDERGNVYTVVASLVLPDGVAEIRDEFDFVDVFTMTNRLHLTTPCECFKELISNFNFQVSLGEHYGLSLDFKAKSKNEWQNAGFLVNYTYESAENEDLDTHTFRFNIFTPFDAVKLLDILTFVEMQESFYRSNFTLKTSQSYFTTGGDVEITDGLIDASFGLNMVSPFYNISAFRVSARKDFSTEERRIEFELNRLNPLLKNIKFEGLWHMEGTAFFKAKGKLQTPFEQLSVVEGSVMFTQNPTDSSASLDLQLSYAPGQQIKVYLVLEGTILTVDMELPIEGFSKAQLNGTLTSNGEGEKLLKAVLLSGGTFHDVTGNVKVTPQVPIMVNINVVTPNKNANEVGVLINIQKKEHGFEMASSFKNGKHKLSTQGEVDFRPNDWNIHLKVETSHPVYSTFSANGRLLKQSDGNMSLELSSDTSVQGLEKLRFLGHYLITEKSGVLRAAFDVTQAKAKLNTEWTWIYMENMAGKIIGSYETRNVSQYLITEAFYRNPKKAFKQFSVGMDLNVNKNNWQFGTNASLAIPSTSNITVTLNLKLPPPQSEVHTIYSKLLYTKDYKFVQEVIKYSTFHSKKLYATYGEFIALPNKIDGNLTLQWGKVTYKSIVNVVKIKRGEKLIDLLYTLSTPKHTEDTFVAKLFYDKNDVYHKLRSDLFCPASHFIAGGHIDYSSFANMHGKVNTTTPFPTISYLGFNFKAATHTLHHQRFLEAFWPNNTALFDSKYKYETKNLDTQINGSVVVEIPLQTRHKGNLVYGYKEGPLRTTGYSFIEYNNRRFLEGRYNCTSQSSAGFEKDVINMEIDNSYSPLGILYIHEYQYSGGSEGLNLPTTDKKRAEIFKLHNKSAFHLTGEMLIYSTLTGQEITLTAIHMNRTVRLKTDYDFLDHEFKQRSVLHLDPKSWASYDITIVNKTTNDKDEERMELNFAYPKRNFTVLGYYQMSNNSLSSELTFVWDKQAKEKRVGASFDWKRLSVYPNKHHAVVSIKHPSFIRDVTLDAQYSADSKDLLDVAADLQYSNVKDQKLYLSGKITDNSQGRTKYYNFVVLGTHPATRLDLKVQGQMKVDGKIYETSNEASYKRSYLPLQTGNLKGRLNTIIKEVELEKRTLRDLSYLKGKFTGKSPLYVVNGTVIKGKDLNATVKFFINLEDKLIQGNINYTPDASESFNMYGKIPDARNAIFSIWRDYEEIRISDVSFYLRLNHSRLVTSKLKWRPEIKSEIMSGIHDALDSVWTALINSVDYWRQYIKYETSEAVNDIWLDAKPIVQNFLDDIGELKILVDDFEEFKIYLNNSYNANEFYIRDIVGITSYIIDELSIRGHIESLPEILNEIWEVMGESGKAIRKSLLWIIETIKTSYKKAVDFINGLLKGDSTAQITALLERFVEKYDRFIKDLHVAFIKQMENLWNKVSTFLWNHWHNFLQTIEPTFIKVLHYLESMVLKASNEILDFLYERKNDVLESPYFSKIYDFGQDLDKLYKDITKNDIITNIRKYSKIVYEFIKEKYFTMVPFGKELQQIANELIDEFKELSKLPSINYAIQKINELYAKVVWVYESLDLGTRIQMAIRIIHSKLTDITQTALQVENKYREAKTKFIFDPESGNVELEQKLPMSWHAFNETPKFEEIPEYRAINEVQAYFIASNFTFWNLFYKYRPLLDPSCWLPPFRAQAMIAGSQHFMTFDRKFFEFQGSCTYLLAHDFVDSNFSLVIMYDPNNKANTHELALIVDKQVVQVNVFEDSVKIQREGVRQLPTAIGDAYIYQEAQILTVESSRGFCMKCNLKFDVCTFTLSGWYFGKTAGVFGTMDNEPSTDFLTSKGTIETDLGRFVRSWAVEPQKCASSKNFALQLPNPDPAIFGLCESFFKLKTSQFSSCFHVIDPAPFLNMCFNSAESGSKDPCVTAVAYMQACLMENTPLRIPDLCVKCHLVNGTELVEGDFRQLEGNAVPQSTDVVFIIEAKECNRNIKEKRNMDSLSSLLTKELTDLKMTANRFAVVVFGGSGVFDKPRSIVVNNNVFTGPQMLPHYFANIPIGNGSADIFGGIRYAAKLLFRPGVSKTFILLPCTNCDPANTTLDYTVLHQVLLENDITLHILMNDEFKFEKDRVNKIFYGMDGKTAFTKKDVKTLTGSSELRRQVRLPKELLGYCTPLALETNGTVFTAKKLESDKKSAVKKFVTVFAKRVAQSARPSSCQTCECTADNNGMSYMECFPCEYPMPVMIDYGFNENGTISSFHITEDEEDDVHYVDSEEDSND